MFSILSHMKQTDKSLNKNVRFYKNEIVSTPDGDFIDKIHKYVLPGIRVADEQDLARQLQQAGNPPWIHSVALPHSRG